MTYQSFIALHSLVDSNSHASLIYRVFFIAVNTLFQEIIFIWGMCLIKGFPLFGHLLNQVNEKKNVELIT